MGIITGYPDDTTVTDSDKYLTSDSSGATKLTSALNLKNYAVADASITTAKVADASITAAKLATGAITLGTTAGWASFSTTSASDVQVTGAALTVTIPSGGRPVKVSVDNIVCTDNTANQYVVLSLWEGTVGSGTLLSKKYWIIPNAGGFEGASISAKYSPSAGSKTYNLGVSVQAGTGGINNYAGGYLTAELR